jgi:hypothetical protein
VLAGSALVTADGSAPGGATPFAATRVQLLGRLGDLLAMSSAAAIEAKRRFMPASQLSIWLAAIRLGNESVNKEVERESHRDCEGEQGIGSRRDAN